MKNKATMLLGLILINSFSFYLNCMNSTIFGFDTLQFRAPYSLGELLHDGFVAVEEIIQGIQLQSLCVVQSLSSSAHILENLEEHYDAMVNKSNMHIIHKGDRDFLQNMIDRIDKLIQVLEQDVSKSIDMQVVITKNIQLLHNLRDKIIN